MRDRRRQLDATRRRLIDRRRAAREGKRFGAFYRGYRDAKVGRTANPYPANSDDSVHWENGRRYAEDVE